MREKAFMAVQLIWDKLTETSQEAALQAMNSKESRDSLFYAWKLAKTQAPDFPGFKPPSWDLSLSEVERWAARVAYHSARTASSEERVARRIFSRGQAEPRMVRLKDKPRRALFAAEAAVNVCFLDPERAYRDVIHNVSHTLCIPTTEVVARITKPRIPR